MPGAVAKSFLVLEAISRARGPVRLTALAEQVGFGASTVHRILGELIELGYVERHPTTGLYAPTLRAWELGSGVVADLPIKQVAGTTLSELHDTTGQTVSLLVRSGDDALYLDKLVAPRPMRFTTRAGSRVPLPLPAGGKAILAFSPDREDVLDRSSRRSDVALPFDVDRIRDAIDRARTNGFAVSSAQRGSRSVAAAILDRGGDPVGALSVSAPADRLKGPGRVDIVDAVVTSATRLTESLGRL